VTHAPLSRMARLALVTLVAGIVLTACGSASTSSTSKTSSSASSGGRARATTLAACLRKHGVTLPTGSRGGGPPSGGGAGAPGGGAPGGGSAKLQAAFKACGASTPGAQGGAGGGFTRQTVAKYVTCVRQHGYSLPKPNFSGKGAVFPASVQSNPKFKSANRTCQSLLRPSGSPGSPPGA
jgi:hypothetical protein